MSDADREARALAQVRLRHVESGAGETREDAVVVEAPVAFLYNGESFAVMMATPCDLEDLALGFALAEGIVDTADAFRLVDVVHHGTGVALHAAIPQARHEALAARRRGLEGRSGCGLCGVAELEAALRPVPRVAGRRAVVAAAEVAAALAALARAQPLNARCGGMHAAGFAHAGGLLVREDVGRHTALDKLVGAMHRAGLDPADGFLVLTSRASHELLHKAATAGIGVVAAMSAPTDLAIRTAAAAGITLAAFARGGQLNLYAHPDGIASE